MVGNFAGFVLTLAVGYLLLRAWRVASTIRYTRTVSFYRWHVGDRFIVTFMRAEEAAAQAAFRKRSEAWLQQERAGLLGPEQSER